MRPVFVAGFGLASALGPDMASGIACLRGGGVAPRMTDVAPGFAWPVHRIDDDDENWWARTQRIVHGVAAESGALAGERRGPLFIASSSLAIGATAFDSIFSDYQNFADELGACLDWRGPVFLVGTACTSALNALMSADAAVAHGQFDDALVLGVELFNRVTIAGFGGMQLLSHDRALPYGQARDGLVLGEAVAALHVSSLPSRWRVRGGSNIVDGSDPAGPSPAAIVTMYRQTLARSGLTPADIDLIKPQAAGGRAGDATEAAALRDVFDPLPVLVSLKAALGHTLGAAGAAELALLLGCIEAGAWPRVDYAQDAALKAPLSDRPPARLRYLLASILGFGGGHAAVVIEDCA